MRNYTPKDVHVLKGSYSKASYMPLPTRVPHVNPFLIIISSPVNCPSRLQSPFNLSPNSCTPSMISSISLGLRSIKASSTEDAHFSLFVLYVCLLLEPFALCAYRSSSERVLIQSKRFCHNLITSDAVSRSLWV